MIKKLFYLIIAILILIPVLMYMHWLFKPAHKLNVLILDKTVLLPHKVQEHISLSWLLENEKYINSLKGAYDSEKDYYGFFPDGKGKYKIKDFNLFTDRQLDSIANNTDVFYYTDLYGIYSNEWTATYYPDSIEDERFISQRSIRYYGGLTATELELLRKAKQKNKLIINEFNIIASPTTGDIRLAYEKEFDIRWTGWVGRYFENLDTLVNMDIPRWLINSYVEQHNNSWPFKKSGIAFVREDDRVEILENETHLEVEVPIINTNKEGVDTYNVAKKIKYPFWFDIIEAGNGMKIISEYELKPNIQGDSILRKWNIPTTFPAAVRSADSKYFYFAGDFCDNPITLRSAKMSYVHIFSFVTSSNKIQDRNSFFWKYYRPLVSTVLKENTSNN